MSGYTGKYDGIEVFSATKMESREILGTKVSEWLRANAGKIELVHTEVTQSSDSEFHCVTITVFYTGQEVWRSPPTSRKA